jgi:D-alanyl-D-alanine carboxypeptidase/D-alanyl-D-alanine-endopeptidase (penicillin-binding protein 4)
VEINIDLKGRSMLRTSRSSLVAVLCSGGLLVAGSTSASASVPSLATQLDQILAGSGATAMSVRVDVAGVGTVFTHSAGQALNPASTEKLLTGYTALRVLGPGHRFVTRIGSTVAADPHGVIHGRLVLTAAGDPTLSTTGGLAELARQLHARGIRKITGGILLDDSLFSRVRVAPHGTTSLDAGDPGPLSAFAVNDNSWRLDRGYRDNPSIGNLQALQRVLAKAGIVVQGHLSVGRPAKAPRPLASTSSKPLSTIVHDMLKQSINFYAETLLEDIGAARTGGSQAGGVKAIRAEAAKLGVRLGGNMVDGSGLSTDDRQSADGEVSWLEAAHADRVLGPQFLAGLPIGCVDGTLKHRMCGTGGLVHAKTGTLDGMRALSGYVTDAAGHLVTFAFLLAGPKSTGHAASNAIDAAVRVLAASRL